VLGALVLLWAQGRPVAPGTDPQLLARIALRRWFSGLTLSGPTVFPSALPWLALISGLGAILILVLVVQGPGRALGQLFDVPGHFRVVGASLSRFRRAGRLVVVLLLAAVASWTAAQTRHFSSPQRLEELALLLKNKGVRDLAVEQGSLAALTPFRDLCGLGDTMLLMLAASVLVFKVSAERWDLDADERDLAAAPAWTTPAWGAAWLYVLYRVVVLIVSPDGYPVSGSLYVEPVIVPVLMLASDGLLFGWVLVELRHALTDAGGEAVGWEASEAVRWLPAAMLACLAALPARVVSVAAFLMLRYLPASALGSLNWLLLGWGLTVVQACSLVLLPLVGAAAMGPMRGGTWLVWWRMLRAEGGRLVAVVAGGVAACGAGAALAYLVLLYFPAASWLLAAADSYSHYATLPLGLMMLATLIELADRTTRALTLSESKPLEGSSASGRASAQDVDPVLDFVDS
jgi:hypothetical protein